MTELKHIGTPRHSGRYPWGSGKNPEQRGTSWLGRIRDLEKQGLTELEIAKSEGISTTQLRAKKSIQKNAKRKEDSAMALRLKEKGYSNVAIGKRMGINESSVRALLDPVLQERADITTTISNVLRSSVEDKKYIDVGAGVENHLGISRTKLNTAIAMLQEEGYKLHSLQVEQLGTGKFTRLKVLTAPDVSYSEVSKNRDQIKMITEHFEDGGRTVRGLRPPQNISSDRIHIRYAEEGGSNKDGVIELRRGVEDLSLGNSKYAQVRIGVDGTHYMKGMAIYSDDVPNGFDIVYNVKKSVGTPKDKVFKAVKDDPDNPFGATVRQKDYIGSDGKSHLSPLNIVNEEGDWSNWSKSISSQVLSKQNPSLAKKQLGLALDIKKEEFEELQSLTNPAVKKVLLKDFADGCDSASVELKAAALPRQSSHVLIPIKNMKENEIYAPNFENGEPVVLIRHPHGGIFEIPELIVNNKNPEAKKVIEGAIDAVGIHPKVASKLSGADFDGDTVLVIPNKSGSIKTAPSLRGLKDFDSIESYPGYEGMHIMTPRETQLEMGKISNLITDMTIKGANEDEIARAVRHSMVVIDAEKHKLNYKQSAIDNNIADLKEKYQGSPTAGSATLISRAGSVKHVPQRKDLGGVNLRNTDPLTGKKIYEYTGKTYTVSLPDKRGPYRTNPLTGEKVYLNTRQKTYPRLTKSTRMAETENAFDLSSGTRMEAIYAEYANNMKDLANKSRKTILETEDLEYSPSARLTYSKEVSNLRSQLNVAFKNKPLERKAQLLANKVVASKRQANPHMEPDDLKKLKGQALVEQRLRVGAKKHAVEISDKEWEAIQAGAISNNILTEILLNTDVDKLKQRALPRTYKLMSPAKAARAKVMLNSGYTRAEVANALGVSISSLDKATE